MKFSDTAYRFLILALWLLVIAGIAGPLTYVYFVVLSAIFTGLHLVAVYLERPNK